MSRETERFDTLAMEALRERAFLKVGAEGVYCAALPESASAWRSSATTAQREPPNP